MNTSFTYPFRVSGIPANVADEFRHLSDDDLKNHNVVRSIADKKPGFPCRISLQDAEIGEPVLLLNFEHLPVSSPYRSIGPVFVRESAIETYSSTNEIPEPFRGRLLSVRAYDDKDMMAQAEVVEGAEIDQLIQQFFADSRVAYLHVHYARPGCFACRIDRA
jgi:hypothetical protein